MACGNAWARDRTCVTAVTHATAVTMLDRYTALRHKGTPGVRYFKKKLLKYIYLIYIVYSFLLCSRVIQAYIYTYSFPYMVKV